jgi:hypothetical protein
MADALGLGPSGEIRGGSSPFSRTNILTPASTPHIPHKSRMRRCARTDPSSRRSVMSVLTGTIQSRSQRKGRQTTPAERLTKWR